MNFSIFNVTTYQGNEYVSWEELKTKMGEDLYEKFKGFLLTKLVDGDEVCETEGPHKSVVKEFCINVGYKAIIRKKQTDAIIKIANEFPETPLSLLFTCLDNEDDDYMEDEEYLLQLCEETGFPKSEVLLHPFKEQSGQLVYKFVAELDSNYIKSVLSQSPRYPEIYVGELSRRKS